MNSLLLRKYYYHFLGFIVKFLRFLISLLGAVNPMLLRIGLFNTAILLNMIDLLAVVGGNEVTNLFMVTEVYVIIDGAWKMDSLVKKKNENIFSYFLVAITQ